MISRLGPRSLRIGMGVWPPYLGAGIRVDKIAQDWSEVRVSMKLRWFNKNYFGTHFGGSLFSMTDPFYALMVVKALGRGYVVWDKNSTIEYVKPGTGRVSATFRLREEIVAAIREETANGEKHFVTLPVEILDEQGEIISRLNKTLYVRQKKKETTL